MNQFPLSAALGVKPVATASGNHPGFDMDEVQKKLGNTRFQNLMAKVKAVFSCGHRHWPSDHPMPERRNAEVHCVYADDLEQFLKAGG